MGVKQLFYLCTLLLVIGSNAVLDGRGYAAGQAKPVHAMLDVRLCTSLPIGLPSYLQLSQGIDNSVMLATEQWKTRFQAAHLALLPPLTLDDAGIGRLDPKREEQNAKACIGRHDIFGFVGPLNSGDTFTSEPILNRAAMLQINPANTNASLTSPVTRKTLEPATFNHRLAYPTFYRLVTTDLLQGPADAAFIRQTLHAHGYFLVDEPGDYESGVAGEAQAYGTKIGLQLVGMAHIEGNSPSMIAASADRVADIVAAKQPDAVFCGCATPDLGAAFASPLRRRGYSGPLVGPDALLSADFITLAGSGAGNSYASNEGLDPAGASKAFRNAYRWRFHVHLQFYDAPAYDAANINLYGIYMAATHGTLRGSLFQMRAAILPYVAHVRWHGATGTTSFDRNGDNRHIVISMYGTRNGKWVFVGIAPQVRGVSPTG